MYLNNISFFCPKDEEINCASKGSMKLIETKLLLFILVESSLIFSDLSKLL